MRASFYVTRPGKHLARYLARNPTDGEWWTQRRCDAWYGPQRHATERAHNYQVVTGYLVVAAQR